MTKKFLTRAYGVRDAASTRDLYDSWAASYDAEIGENGYATPGRCATALRTHVADPTLPILDFGCGTGLSGLALKLAGFTTIDGLDVSTEMLEQARAKDLYRKLSRITAGTALMHTPGDYAAIAAIGVIGAGAAPVTVLDTILDRLAAGGKVVFSFNDHALDDPVNEAKVQSCIDSGTATLLGKTYGDHLPGINLNSNVYVLEKT